MNKLAFVLIAFVFASSSASAGSGRGHGKVGHRNPDTSGSAADTDRQAAPRGANRKDGQEESRGRSGTRPAADNAKDTPTAPEGK